MATTKKTIDGQLCLHQKEFQDSVKQLRYMADHSKSLESVLNVVIERTYAAAPKRAQGYLLERGAGKNPHKSQRERSLEKAFWKQYKQDKKSALLHAELCPSIQTFQMPLKGKHADKSWGKIDLVGISRDSLPIVVELKKETATDTPLRILAEGLAYAVALRRAWNEGNFRTEWEDSVMKNLKAPETILEVPVIGLAPAKFWEKKAGTPGKRSNGQVPEEAWRAFHSLCEACGKQGFPISFLSFTVDDNDCEGFPRIAEVSRWEVPFSKTG